MVKLAHSADLRSRLRHVSSAPGVFVDFSVARGELPPPRYGCLRMNYIAARNQTFASYLSLKLSGRLRLKMHKIHPVNLVRLNFLKSREIIEWH